MNFTEGQRVRHKKNGLGTVRRAGMNQTILVPTVSVQFDSGQWMSFVDTDQPFFNRFDELEVTES